MGREMAGNSETGNGNEVLDWEWKWDRNGNDSTGMGSYVNERQ